MSTHIPFVFILLILFSSNAYGNNKVEIRGRLISTSEKTKMHLYGPTSRKNQFVLLYFWTTWCKGCQGMPQHLQNVQKQFGNRVQIIDIALQANKERVARFLRKTKANWPHYIATNGFESKMASLLGIVAIPHWVLISPSRTIVKTGSSKSATKLFKALQTHIARQN